MKSPGKHSGGREPGRTVEVRRVGLGPDEGEEQHLRMRRCRPTGPRSGDGEDAVSSAEAGARGWKRGVRRLLMRMSVYI